MRNKQIPVNYFDSKYKNKTFSDLKEIIFPKDNYRVWQREDFSILLQAYQQLPGTRDLSVKAKIA
ncbi:MAG: hypothetical protein ACD_44C00195G0005 [uncultured bacterium]|nr:MAG: hypothetical protein ACD_44C00195G0005 [uncultured bacterium]OGT15076.1 MAG: hypothetical protein A3B69_04500 [Gammaproteobacteria bacterium RIFCSPHIGHO2_02_FULL_38_33]OGT23341.1 MAG: hypothetical protein A2W47_03900 [Gammaproteobacteria bacterium RIFCSPHIGHO2_12_38_15]OGT66798.1 MAG: hypothetical protein A3I12_01890 [Gammaproteobacteria bacterium RIFCSPLOWO2_02_FULL_38_11]OGT75911.1 MAG: hypothetical protein A3G71_04270 [Gammaproteobacteria bacterium RIFCSPLOWO2_12_FULL_38_14]